VGVLISSLSTTRAECCGGRSVFELPLGRELRGESDVGWDYAGFQTKDLVAGEAGVELGFC